MALIRRATPMNVLLLPATATAAAISHHLTRWSAAGLLRPFCVWTVDDPDAVEVCRVIDGERKALTLASALASADPGAVGFAAFHPAAIGERFDGDFAELVARCLATAGRVVDYEPGGALGCPLAVLPATPDQPVPPQLFRPGWDGIYVAPEDRAAPQGINLLVGDEERYVRHAAHAVATLAQVWATPETHRPDLLPRMRAAPAGPLPVGVRLVRCFSRAVELGHIADHVAEAALREGDGWPSPGAERFERADDPGPIVERLARRYVEKHAETLAHRTFEPVVERAPRPLGLRAALRALLWHLAGRAVERSVDAIDDAIGAVHDLVARRIKRLAGPDSDIHVRYWFDLPAGERSIERLEEQLDDEPLAVHDGPVRETWRDLRLLALGLVDGSELPDGIGAEQLDRAGCRTVICNPDWLAHDRHAAADDDGSDEGDAPAPLLARIHAAVAAELAKAEQELSDLDDAIAADARAADEARRAAVVRRRARWWRRLPRPRRPRRRRGRMGLLVRRFLLLCLLAAAACVYVWTHEALVPAAEMTAAIALLWGLATALIAQRTLRRPRIVDDPEARRALIELNARLQLAEARADVARLRRRLTELADWSEILAELLHRPWVREPFGLVELPELADQEAFPAAFALAVAEPDARVLARIGSRARAYAFSRGWLTNVYRHVERDTMREWVIARRGTRPAPDPAADTSTDPDSPRRALWDAVERGDGRRLHQSPVTADLLQSVDEARLDELAPAVLPSGGEAQPAQPSTMWIDPPDGVESVPADRARHVVAVGGGSGLVVAPRTVLTAASVVARLREPTVRLSTAQRGDSSQPSIPVDQVVRPERTPLALLLVAPDALPKLDPPPTGPAREGAPVVALDLAEGGAVEHRWGFVARAGETAVTIAYDGTPPRSGAPVFDLSGRLVAIQLSQARAHRVDDLRQLLERPTGLLPPPGPGLAHERRLAVPATTHLAAVANGPAATALNPDYWYAITDANAIVLALPPAVPLAGEATRIDRLTSGAAFMRPLRAMVHRVESTRPVAPSALEACRRASREWLVDEVDAEHLAGSSELADAVVGREGHQA